MKYSVSIDIDAPRQRVSDLLQDVDSLKEWLPDLVSHKQVKGEPGQVGAVAEMKVRMGKKEIDMTETVLLSKPPETYSATYEAQKVWNRVDNTLTALDNNRTRWTMDCEFRCGGFLWLIALLMPSAFRKQSLKDMQRFKDFAERQ
jgi:uncharacterized protein YndB with AHSA1/START domain